MNSCRFCDRLSDRTETILENDLCVFLQKEEAVLGVKKKFQDRFTKILGNNRTDNFYRKDIQFRAKLVERLRKMRQQNNINQRPMRRKPGM